MNHSRIFPGLVWLFLLMGMTSIGLFAYSLVEPPPLTYQNRPFPVLTEKVRPGSAVQLSAERCSSADSVTTYGTTHALRNEKTKMVILLPDMKLSIDPGCHSSISRINVVPESTPPGMYAAFGIATVDGFFKSHRAAWNSEVFEVTGEKQ